jgi:hypothetical protein
MKTTVLRRSELYRQVWKRTLTSLGAAMGIEPTLVAWRASLSPPLG